MNYRSLLIVCLATLGLAVAGWGQADGKDVELPAGVEQAVTSSDEGAWVVGAIRRLTDSAGYRSPSWSLDGQHIAYVSRRGSHGKAEIYVMDSDGSNPRRLTDHSANYRSPSWSPDGQHIAFESNRDGDWGIYVMDIASYTGGEPTAVAETSWGRIKALLSTGTR
ncbi:MAG: PD40 domain-containing protein [Candidatus Latescibacteria bacterium]|nr:PD40 domain-containing protein [Candidatus Latescibacterota bacterium]